MQESNQRNDSGFRVLINRETLGEIIAYRAALAARTAEPGPLLKRRLDQAGYACITESATRDNIAAFIQRLLETRQTVHFAESGANAAWTPTELHLLRKIPVHVEGCTVFDDGRTNGTRLDPLELADVVYPAGAILILNRDTVDVDRFFGSTAEMQEALGILGGTDSAAAQPIKARILENLIADQKAALLPSIIRTIQKAQAAGKKPVIVVPPIGCGYFCAATLRPIVRNLTQEALLRTIASLDRGVLCIFTGVSASETERTEVLNNGSVFCSTRTLALLNTEEQVKTLLNSRINALSEEAQAIARQYLGDNDNEHQKTVFVAGDHLSIPGNESNKRNYQLRHQNGAQFLCRNSEAYAIDTMGRVWCYNERGWHNREDLMVVMRSGQGPDFRSSMDPAITSAAAVIPQALGYKSAYNICRSNISHPTAQFLEGTIVAFLSDYDLLVFEGYKRNIQNITGPLEGGRIFFDGVNAQTIDVLDDRGILSSLSNLNSGILAEVIQPAPNSSFAQRFLNEPERASSETVSLKKYANRRAMILGLISLLMLGSSFMSTPINIVVVAVAATLLVVSLIVFCATKDYSSPQLESNLAQSSAER